MKHGASAYRHGLCRCEVCRADVYREVSLRAARLAADPSLAPHGDRSTYTNWGCRCADCTRVHVAYCADRRKLRGVR